MANYGGSVAVLEVRADDTLAGPLHVWRPSAENLPAGNPRFDAPHPHFAQRHGSHVFVCDLGRNAIATLTMDP